jgi:CBS domain-containing protein
VREITLFALGGVSQIEQNPTSARTEFWMAFVGPLTSAVIGALCLGVRVVTGVASSTPTYAMLSWLGYINLSLAAFNMVPGYPLDGGRILRAAIWWKTGNLERSTLIAGRVGQAVGVFFITMGIIQFFGGAGLNGLWIAFIGWFLLQAARETYMQTGIDRAFAGVTVANIMSHDCPVIDGNTNIQHFVNDWLLHTGNRCFMIMNKDGALAGLVTPEDVKSIDRQRWPFTTLYDIVRPLDAIRTIGPETPLRTALEIMGREDLAQLPVVENSKVVGVLSSARLLNYLQMRSELGA